MPASLNLHTVIAFVWDFDKTLSTSYMQAPLFDYYGVDQKAFWDEVNGLVTHYQARGLQVSRQLSAGGPSAGLGTASSRTFPGSTPWSLLLGGFYQDIGVLVVTEVVGKNVAAVLYSTGIKEMWQVLEPYVRGERQLRSAKGLGGFWGSFEYLADAYQAACSATDHAVTGLDAVAVTINAPTRVLAAARAAISPPPDTGERLTATAPGQPGQRLPASTPQRPDWPGSVEQAVRNIGSPDLILLMRARAIDKLANKLIAEAKQPSKDVDRASRADARGPSAAIARNPVRVAGENFPLNPRATSAASRPVSMPPRSAARLRTKGC